MGEYPTSFEGVQWDSEQYDYPWDDPDLLRTLYERGEGKTHQEIGDLLGVSRSTITDRMPDDAQRGGPGLPYEDVALFSGGHDSLVSTHYAMEKLGCDAVVHINTLTGIDENQWFVEDVCDQFGWTLEIITPNKTLEEFAKEYGFPKEAAHSWIYRYFKEHPLARFTTSLEVDTPHYYTGVRRAESERRMRNVTSETQEHDGGRWIWEAPIADWTEEDIEEYISEHDLPSNPVVETIGRSGECFCGAYADRISELEVLQENYPNHYEWLMEVEDRVQESIGTNEGYCYWGSIGLTDEQLQEMDDDVADMKLCADCEGGGHRSIGADD